MRCKDCRSWDTSGGKKVVRSEDVGLESFGKCTSDFFGYVPKKGRNKGVLKGKKNAVVTVLLPADGDFVPHGTFGCVNFEKRI